MVFTRPDLKFFVTFILSLQAAIVFASDANPPPLNRHLMERAIQIQVTPRGMVYFEKNLTDILGNIGVNLDEGYFPAQTYTMNKPINPDDYAKTNPDAVATYKQLKDLLSTWLVGFSLNPHLLTVEIGQSGYVAQFSRFAIVTDESVMRSLQRPEGAVLAIELEIKHLGVSTDSILAWDLNNPFLGKSGLENVTVSIGNELSPLKIRLPFYIHMDANRRMVFEALQINNNIMETNIDIQYQKLLIPTFAIELNGKKFYLNYQEASKFFNKKTAWFIQNVRSYLSDFTRNDLPSILNQKAKEYLSGTLEQVQDMPPPGKSPQDSRPDFKWGLMLDNIDLSRSLRIDVNAYIEDILNGNSSPRPSANARDTVKMDALPMGSYDVGFSIDRAVINRVMQLAYERKNFERIDTGGNIIKLMAPPTIDFAEGLPGIALKPQETFFKLHVSIENKPHSVFLKESIILNFDIIGKLAQIPGSEDLQLILLKIDDKSMTMNPVFLSMAGVLLDTVSRDRVYEGIRQTLRETSANWATTLNNIPGSLPLPPKILGINLEISRLHMNPTGHLVMYLNYAKNSPVSSQRLGVSK